MKRILIQNGTVYDGLGGQPYQARKAPLRPALW